MTILTIACRDFGGVDVYKLFEPFFPSHVYMTADSCGNYVRFAFAWFTEEQQMDAR